MDRRQFLGAASLGFLAAPFVVEAQPPAKVRRIGLLGGSPPNSPEAAPLFAPAGERGITAALWEETVGQLRGDAALTALSRLEA